MDDLTDVEAAITNRDELEKAYSDLFRGAVSKFLKAVLSLVRSSNLTASTAVKDEFSYMAVMDRWNEALHEMSRLDDAEEAFKILKNSDLPQVVFSDVEQVFSEGSYRAERMAKLEEMLYPEGDRDSRYEGRVRTLARSSATRRFNSDRLNELAKQGYRRKRWAALMDADTRESHREVHGQSVELGEAFQVGNETMMYPGDVTASFGEYANCRCVLLGEYADQETVPLPLAVRDVELDQPIVGYEDVTTRIWDGERDEDGFKVFRYESTGEKRPVMAKFSNKLAVKEEKALDEYVVDEVHEKLGNKLRSKNIPVKEVMWGSDNEVGDYSGADGLIDALDGAIRRSKTTRESVVYRGMALKPDSPLLTIGTVFEDKNYMSTTLEWDVADMFAKHRAGVDVGLPESKRVTEENLEQFIFTIIVPEGTNVTLMSDAIKECVLMRNTKFRIEHIERNNVIVRILP